MQEAYIRGISTRSVDDLVKALGMSGISKSQVSRGSPRVRVGLATQPYRGFADDHREAPARYRAIESARSSNSATAELSRCKLDSAWARALHAIMDGETDGKAKLTAAWRAAVARMIEAGYNPADIHETMISVGLSGTVRPRLSYTMLVGVAIVGVSALLLFSDMISTHPSAIWRTLSGSRNQTSEQQEALGRERKDAEHLKRDLAAARSEIEALKAEGSRALVASGEAVRAAEAKGGERQEALGREREEAERLKRNLAAARSEIEALKAEGSRALAASGEAVRAAEAKGVEQQEALGREREEAERLKRDLAAARSEIEALKAEGARALVASGEAVRAAEAKGVEQQEALGREREEAERLKRDLAAAAQ